MAENFPNIAGYQTTNSVSFVNRAGEILCNKNNTLAHYYKNLKTNGYTLKSTNKKQPSKL